MKKIKTLLALAALVSSSAFAQTDNLLASCTKKCQVETTTTLKKDVKQQQAPNEKQEFAWGIGLLSIVVIGTVAGITAGMASQSN